MKSYLSQQSNKESKNKPDGGKNAVALQDNRPETIQRKTNNTGLPDNLKSGIENLSGHSMDDVKVHYNSNKPAQLNAHAYAQGTDIHIASGQEKHLAHEAWHVVQQKQGRVRPTKQMKSKVNINDDVSLEKEADVMGAKAINLNMSLTGSSERPTSKVNSISQRKEKLQISRVSDVAQRAIKEVFATGEKISGYDNSLAEFTGLVHQLMQSQDSGWNLETNTFTSSGALPVQLKLMVGSHWVSAAKTIRNRVQENAGNSNVADILIQWANDSRKKGRSFSTWGDAIAAAGASLDSSWDWKKTVTVLLILLVIVGVPLGIWYMSAPGNDRGSNNTGILSPNSFQQVNRLRNNPNVTALHNLTGGSVAHGMIPATDNLRSIFPQASGISEVESHLKPLESELESLAPALTPKKSQIEQQAKKGASMSQKASLKKPEPQKIKETTIGKDGKIEFGSEKDRNTFDSGGGGQLHVETKAIRSLLKSTKTGNEISKSVEGLGENPLFLRRDLGSGRSGEADPRENRYITLHSKRGYVQNTIIAAHELKHREQFALGQIDGQSNPYRLATAEIYAKKVGLDMYTELHAKGYIPPMDKDTQDQEFDLIEHQKDPKAYERKIYRQYLNLYSKGDTKKYPDFKDDHSLDKHIADQKAYFEARKQLFFIEKEIRERGYSPDNTPGLPKDLKGKLLRAREVNRKARRKANDSQPK